MITIFFSRKGGAGKSTLAAQLAAVLSLAKKRVAIIDTDPQGTLGNWSVYRHDHEGCPPITFIASRHGLDLDYAIEKLNKGHDHVIVDLQGSDTKENRETLLHADKIIIPFKPTQPDLDNLPYICEMLTELKKDRPALETHFVINEAAFSSARLSEIDQARTYFASYKIKPLTTVIHRRKAYRDSMATGLGASELKDKKAIAEIDGLWSEIYIGKKRRQKPTSVSQKTANSRQKKA